MQAALRNVMIRAVVGLGVVVLLAACTPPVEDVIVDVDGSTVNTSGLEERLPDTCNLSNYDGYVGQPLAAILIPSEVETRVVRPSTIVSQVYVSSRVNFYVGDDDVITRVICG